MADKINISGPIACPVCGLVGFDGEDCTACGFNAEFTSVETYQKKIEKAKRRQSKAGKPISPIMRRIEAREKRRTKRKAKLQALQPIVLKSGTRIFKKGAQPLSTSELEAMKNRKDENEGLSVVCSSLAAEVLRMIDAKIKEKDFQFSMARWKMVKGVAENLKDQL